jgi:hypothetical protein
LIRFLIEAAFPQGKFSIIEYPKRAMCAIGFMQVGFFYARNTIIGIAKPVRISSMRSPFFFAVWVT